MAVLKHFQFYDSLLKHIKKKHILWSCWHNAPLYHTLIMNVFYVVVWKIRKRNSFVLFFQIIYFNWYIWGQVNFVNKKHFFVSYMWILYLCVFCLSFGFDQYPIAIKMRVSYFANKEMKHYRLLCVPHNRTTGNMCCMCVWIFIYL